MVDKIWYNMEELIGGSEERVLIETYWNVKMCGARGEYKCQGVLIETYWNVKLCRFFTICLAAFCINRNILECKVLYQKGS